MNRLEHTFRALVLASCGVAAVMGLLGLLGWAFQAKGLLSVFPDMALINPATALALLALAVGLGAAEVPARRPISRVLGSLVGLLGLAVLADAWLGTAFGLDRILFGHQALAVASSDRMALSTATCLVFLGVALLTLEYRPTARVRPAEALSLIAAIICFQSLMGYAYFALRLINPVAKPMAFLAAIGLFALSLGLLCARPYHGLMREVASPHAGGRIIRRLLPAWLALPFLLAPVDQALRRYVDFDRFTLPQIELIVLAIGMTYWVGAWLNREDEDHLTLEARVAEGERHLRRILSHTFDIIAVFQDNRLSYVNEAGLRALGVASAERVLGTPLAQFLSPDISESHRELVQHGQEVPVIGTTLVRPDGQRLEVELASMRITYRGREAVQVVARDVTERQRREALIQAERDLLEQIAAGIALPRILRAITHMVESQAQGMLATILLVDEAGKIHVGAADSLPDWYNREVEGQPIGPKAGSCGTAAYRKQTVMTPDIATDPLWENYREAALKAGLAASWSTPLFGNDHQVVGTLAYYYRTPQDPTPQDVRLAEVARHLSEIAIGRIRADQAIRQARDELEQRVAERTEQLRKDIAEREQAEAQLRSRERMLKEAQSLAHMGSWEWDMVQNEVHWSDELYRIYGLTPQSFGATFEAFLAQIRPTDRERVRQVVQASAQSCQPYAIEERIIRPDGEERVLASSGRVDTNGGGRPVRMWGICLDITERKRAEAEVRQLNATLERRIAERTAQLEAANQELEAFSYSVSHDLRAPLRSIDGFSQALLEDYGTTLDETGQDYLRRVRAASQRMAQLIDDILHLSRLTRGELQWAPVDLSALAREVADEVREADPSRHVTFAIESGLTARGDARLLQAALENLIGNAWKFTSHHPTARIAVGATVQHGRQVFFVQDDGAGFDMAYADKLFKPFSRLHTTEEFPGTGIGLATVQRIVHRHGGRIWVESAVERGATVFFTLGEEEE